MNNIQDALDELSTLNESSVSRLYDYLQSCDVCFITAFIRHNSIKKSIPDIKGSDAKSIRRLQDAEEDRNKILAAALHSMMYTFFKVKGAYEYTDGDLQKVSKEDSYAVVSRKHNDEQFLKDMISLMREFDQEAIMIVEAGSLKAKIIKNNGSEEYIGKLSFDQNNKNLEYTLLNGKKLTVVQEDFYEPEKYNNTWLLGKYKREYEDYKRKRHEEK